MGYNLEDKNYKLLLLNYQNMNENGNEIPTDASIILNQILNHEERANQIIPSATIIKSNATDIRTVVGLYGQYSGEMVTQWFLYKENNESDPKFDYFAIKDIIRINKLGGSTNSKKLTVTHDVIYAKDDLYNTSADTAKWIITPGFLKNLQGSDRLELGSSWKANPAYTYTGVQVSHVSEWHSAIEHMFDLSNTFNVGV